MITFLLNSIEHRIDDIDPNTTVLDYLRDHLGRTGTKEGCASGDCGACTVVVARVSADNQLQYRSINACITPIGSLHGQQLLTVEDLAADGDLHPAQEAMVECHGSQCGFCTPGFVMSLYAHYQNHAQPDRQEILESLGGNLCRCTGYRPILDAAVAMYDPALEATPDQPPTMSEGHSRQWRKSLRT
ncbi:2Fe-2S iron-sulfur cluster-binding protein [Halioglobus japonicus]|uniref:2Fe-2S iron-sulfur cluster-binding protein n=1 Tax=Halioglobus japonicus TaxID=930805 RepID=UPI00197AC0E5|nr:2Fe-2S iron-sulfur cluster-binding protein [Halioglobus japonicus]